MRLFPEETISLCRKILNRTGYRGVSDKVYKAGREHVFAILSINIIDVRDLDSIAEDCELEKDELDYYYQQCNLRTK
jgi:hypothetical protein